MRLEEEKSRALGREQQTLRWIPLLPARPGALRPPCLRHPRFALAAFRMKHGRTGAAGMGRSGGRKGSVFWWSKVLLASA